jgi:signal transduction histidine kinase
MRLLPTSYRQRLPLSLSIAAVATAVLMALALGLQTLKNLREDQGRNALRLGHAMSGVLIQALRHNDVWLAYSLLRGPERTSADATWILVDETGRIFASNRPTRYRVDQPLVEVLPWLPPPAPGQSVASVGATHPNVLTVTIGKTADRGQDRPRRLLRLPLPSDGASDGAAVGELIALLSDAPFLARFDEILQGGLLVTSGVLAVLLPLGWLWGRRMAAPLTTLAECMTRVGAIDPRALHCPVPQGDSEIGQLGRRFAAMVDALAEQQDLEHQMLQSERLAAVGRVAAGVAHEINNPLGGMLMAIDTFRRRQPADPHAVRLLDLLDRGLQQIQHTVSALLVEARLDGRPLTPQDLEDVRTLARPQSVAPGARLTWENGLAEPVPLPANLGRQLLLNLMLNAQQAVDPDGRLAVQIVRAPSGLLLQVENSGEPIPPARLSRVFEPYPSRHPDRQGLGLWVCYQIVTQLGGTIEAQADERSTRLRVHLPIDSEADHD